MLSLVVAVVELKLFVCIVSQEVVQASLSIMDYKVNPSICQFLKHIHAGVPSGSVDKLRMIVFGGSVTIGSDAGGGPYAMN